MSKPTFQIKTLKSTDNFAQIAIEPLEPGFGHTLGVALRRVLLEHIRGAAVTTVQIKGVNHQFTTLEGMREDIVELILNLKQLKFTYQGTEAVTATLTAQGPAEVKAREINLPAGVELANPDFVLANLADKKTQLDLTLTIESGQGYSPAEDRPVTVLGVIPIDAIFSPVTKVDFTVSDTRVGRFTNFNKLIMDIWTDSTIQPEPALTQAAEILVGYFQQIVSPTAEAAADTDTQSHYEPELYKITVEELELPTRIANALRKAGLGTIKDLVGAKKAEVAKIKNLGSKSVELVDVALKSKGVGFVD